MQRVKISKNKAEYSEKENLDDNYDLAEHLSRDILSEKSSIVIGNKKNYLLYRGKNYEEVGYCYSMGYSMDVIRTEFAKLMNPDKNYEIHIKKPSPTEYKIYLYEYSEGYIYNGLIFLDKFKVREIPKIERRDPPILETLIIKSKPKETSEKESKPSNKPRGLPTILEEPKSKTKSSSSNSSSSSKKEKKERREKKSKRD